jgi:WD40 repeat protein
MLRKRLNPSVLLLVLTGITLSHHDVQADESAKVSFKQKIAPILVDQCIGCHNEKKSEGTYSMATFEQLVKGSDRGPAVEPSKPVESILSKMLHGTEEPTMPFETDPLVASDIALIDQWIREGAHFDGNDLAVPIRNLVLDVAPSKAEYRQPPPLAALAYRPDGKALAASGYHEITFWNPADGQLLSRLSTRVERIHSLAWTPDGARLLYAGGTPGRLGEVVLVNETTRDEAKVLFQSNDMVLSAIFRPNGSHVAAGGTDRLFRIWETETGKEISAIENHADWVLGLAYTPDGNKLLSASRDRSVKVWDQERQEALVTFSKHTDAATGVACSPDGTLACSVGNDRIIRIWKIDGSAEQVREIGGHADVIHKVLWARTKPLLITAGGDKRIIAWNPTDGSVVREFAGSTDVVYSLALSSDESRLAAGSYDGQIRIYNVDSGELLTSFLAVPSSTTAATSTSNKP